MNLKCNYKIVFGKVKVNQHSICTVNPRKRNSGSFANLCQTFDKQREKSFGSSESPVMKTYCLLWWQITKTKHTDSWLQPEKKYIIGNNIFPFCMWPFEICMALLLCNRKLIYVGRQSSNGIHFTLHQYHISKFLKPSKPPNSASYWELNRFNLLQANIACLGWKAPLFKGFCTRGVMKNSLICLCLLWLKSYIKYLYISNQRSLILNYVLPYVYFRVCVCVYILY